MRISKRGRLIALAAVTTLQIGGPLASQPAGAALPGANGRLAYSFVGVNEEREGRWGIATVLPSGARDRVVWSEPFPQGDTCLQDCGAAAWAPDGKRLAFDAGSRLAIMRSDGSRLRLLASRSVDDSEPTFSPDGKRLAFTAQQPSARTDVLILDLVSGRTRVLARDAQEPSWSSRNRIAFVRAGNIFTVRASGRGGVEQLTHRGGAQPDWSADGSLIAFVAERPANAKFSRERLYVVRANGRGLRRVPHVGVGVFEPAWSPDGTRIAYEEAFTGILTISPNGKRRRIVIESQVGDSGSTAAGEPAWQPRG